jgi:hypothetical protein
MILFGNTLPILDSDTEPHHYQAESNTTEGSSTPLPYLSCNCESPRGECHLGGSTENELQQFTGLSRVEIAKCRIPEILEAIGV